MIHEYREWEQAGVFWLFVVAAVIWSLLMVALSNYNVLLAMAGMGLLTFGLGIAMALA